MTNRERLNAVLHYREADRMPVVHFGWWKELLEQWRREGHLTQEESTDVRDGGEKDRVISEKLGFDFNYSSTFGPRGAYSLYPAFEEIVLKELPDGSRHLRNREGAIVLEKPGVVSIPGEIGYTLADRAGWEEYYLPRLQWSEERIHREALGRIARESDARTEPMGLMAGSLFGQVRNWMGVEGLSYLGVDDEELYDEILATVADICLRCTEEILKSGAQFDFVHFWEDIAFNTGPLVSPSTFMEKVGPHYRRITDVCRRYGVDIVSVDCDGAPDLLIPTWLENGVNTMFPIEVGVWGGSFAPWRERYGRELRGVGGMNKHVLSQGYAAVDAEIERLRPIVELGGYIPCPDHRLPPGTVWETVQYYCERMKRVFG